MAEMVFGIAIGVQLGAVAIERMIIMVVVVMKLVRVRVWSALRYCISGPGAVVQGWFRVCFFVSYPLLINTLLAGISFVRYPTFNHFKVSVRMAFISISEAVYAIDRPMWIVLR